MTGEARGLQSATQREKEGGPISEDARAAIVTGGGTGIGRGIAHRLAEGGWRVAVVGRREDPLRETVASAPLVALTGRSASMEPHVADVTSEGAVESLFARIRAQWGRVDALVNNAGVPGPIAPVWEQSLEGFEQTLRSNVSSAFLCSRAAAQLMWVHGDASIVTIGSVTGKRPLTGRTPYAAAKMALIGLTRTLAVELGPADITVNLVSPGAVETERLATLAEAAGLAREDLREQFASLTALGRISSVDDVAGAVEFLISDRARNITGIDLNVDAGVWFS